jgi:hypothetical protein
MTSGGPETTAYFYCAGSSGPDTGLLNHAVSTLPACLSR